MGDTKKLIHIRNVSGNVNIGDSPEYQVSSAINELLKVLANKPFKFEIMMRRPSAETIIKINHNNLRSKKHVIKQYLDYSSKIEEAYLEIDSLVAFGKNTILRNIYDLYYSALDEVGIDYMSSIVDINLIRRNSDFIFDFIVQKLKNTVFESKNTPVIKEHIELGVNVVVAHAFIECIILENP
ncbi:ABC-three component system protein [Nitrosomonas supralitoralis]|uniref:ABC-three component systems C-terminal domain-containing protein n=1 Tax=Nitrosomonas supralitoralis TaxID=2116706 RepID=A0A2P7NXG1_9PROT|nr:ABC-three component system protein [Nitrosomonas supralitoralis]PSJ18153.1 hypothetical protein C7H79_04705 [Nitrosomonas supralitoralis]